MLSCSLVRVATILTSDCVWDMAPPTGIEREIGTLETEVRNTHFLTYNVLIDLKAEDESSRDWY